MTRTIAGLLLITLAACTGEAPAPAAEETDIPEELAQAAAPTAVAEGLGTPLAERVATLGLINKRNNRSQDIEMRPGEARRFGDVIIRLAACERTAPWEEPQETGAFVQVLVNERASAGDEPQWRRVFSGWLFENNPSLNVVEHPVYDVWVKDCAMSFPGEEEALGSGSDGDEGAEPRRRAAPSAPAAAAPAPAAEPAPAAAPATSEE